MQRKDQRPSTKTRPVRIEPGIAPHASGSVLISFGRTQVICTAMIEEGVPRWMKEQQVTGGWITAEYSMLPYSTRPRKPRDISKGKLDGRSGEIQRLIGRSLRAVVDLEALGQRTLWVDCDVLAADGGTRTASITGACVAIAMAGETLKLRKPLLRSLVAAVSVGVVDGEPMVDLDYDEDKAATVDMNLVMNDTLQFVEVQGAGEESTFSHAEFLAMLELGKGGISDLLEAQRAAIAEAAATIL